MKCVWGKAGMGVCALFLILDGSCMAREKVRVFHAGSLSVPFAEMEKAFESV